MKKRIENSYQIKNSFRTGLMNKWFAIGLIIIATAIVYIPSLKAPFILDDMSKIVENSDIKKLSNLKTKLIYPYSDNKTFERNDPSRPLVYLTFTLNYYFSELNTFGYHLFNLILHIFISILIFMLTRKIILYAYKEDKILFSFFVALLFAVHPVNTSAVTYIFSRSVLLATFFYVLSILLFIQTFERKNRIIYICSLVSFILALFSRQDVVTLPAIILLFDYVFLSDFSIKKLAEKKYYHIPYWLILAGYILFRYIYFGGLGDVEVKDTAIWNRYSYLSIQPYIILRYLELLLLPVGLCMDHLIKPVKILDPKTIISFLSLAALFWLACRIYKKKTDNSKIILFCVFWFLIILSPTSSFFPTTSALVENRMYLSGVGFFFMLVLLYFAVFKSNNLINLSIVLMSVYICLLGYGTIKRNQLYQQPILMWQDVISKYPNNAKAHNNLGILLKNSKRFEEAEKEYREAIRINPDYAEAYNNLGNLLNNLRRFEEAEKEYREAIRINPDYAEAYNNLGNLLNNLRRFEEAEKEYREAIRINPNLAEAYNNLGVLLDNSKRFEEAEREYREAIRLYPNYGSAHGNLGALLSMLKRYDEAEKEFREAIKINPNSIGVHFELGFLLEDLNRFEAAEKEFREIIRINPKSTNAHYNLGVLLYNSKRFKEADAEFQAAKKNNDK